MVDSEGFRPNVGIVITNYAARVLWARRIGQNAWQFPQGGIKDSESPEDALYRELGEEVGLGPGDVRILGATRGWLRYRLPRHMVRRREQPVCIGQKQVWFLLRLERDDTAVCLDASTSPEFDHWQWVTYWEPMLQVVFFKRRVYAQALRQLAPLLAAYGVPARPPQRPE